jgi:hypothetical protein
MKKPSCGWLARVDAHFAGKNSVDEEAEMRRHLSSGCADCRFRYTRQAMLAKTQPDAPTAQDRLARSLGFGPPPRRWTGLWAMAAASGMAVILLIFMIFPRTDEEDDGFQARGVAGAELPEAELRVFRIRTGGAPELVTGKLSAADELSFAYRNATGKRHLFVFGVDEHGHVYWFWPAWRSAHEQPAAPLALGDGAFHEIEDAVGHRYDGTRLHLHALFTDRAWKVKELEAAISGMGKEVGANTAQGSLSAGDVSLIQTFEVTH